MSKSIAIAIALLAPAIATYLLAAFVHWDIAWPAHTNSDARGGWLMISVFLFIPAVIAYLAWLDFKDA